MSAAAQPNERAQQCTKVAARGRGAYLSRQLGGGRAGACSAPARVHARRSWSEAQQYAANVAGIFLRRFVTASDERCSLLCPQAKCEAQHAARSSATLDEPPGPPPPPTCCLVPPPPPPPHVPPMPPTGAAAETPQQMLARLREERNVRSAAAAAAAAALAAAEEAAAALIAQQELNAVGDRTATPAAPWLPAPEPLPSCQEKDEEGEAAVMSSKSYVNALFTPDLDEPQVEAVSSSAGRHEAPLVAAENPVLPAEPSERRRLAPPPTKAARSSQQIPLFGDADGDDGLSRLASEVTAELAQHLRAARGTTQRSAALQNAPNFFSRTLTVTLESLGFQYKGDMTSGSKERDAKTKQQCCRPRLILLFVVCIVAAIAVGAGMGISLGGIGKGSSSPAPASTPAGVAAPSPLFASPPPPPLPPPLLTYSVQTAVGLAGYTSLTFDASAQAAFVSGMAGALSVLTSSLRVTSVSDYTVGSGRRMLDTGINVAFSVDALGINASVGSDLASKILLAFANPTSLVASLRSAGLTGVTGAELTRAPAVALANAVVPSPLLAPPNPPPSPPPPSPPSPPPSPPPPSPPPPNPPPPSPQLIPVVSGNASTLACTRQDSTCYALAQFYEATNGTGWAQNGGWSAARAGVTTDYCAFYGASCDANNVLVQLCVRAGTRRVWVVCVVAEPLVYLRAATCPPTS